MSICLRCKKGKHILAFSRHKKGSSGAGGNWALRAPIHQRTQRPNLHTYKGEQYCTSCLRIVKVKFVTPVEAPAAGGKVEAIVPATV